jgi:Domain of unknown function (DUF6894)
MALFYFIVRVGRKTFPDPVGEEFDDIADARAHAHAVAGELMRNRENSTGHWRLQVCDDYLQPCYECLFADVDQRLQAYGDVLRGSMIRVVRTTAALNDAVQNIDDTMSDLRQTMRLLDAVTPRFSALTVNRP